MIETDIQSLVRIELSKYGIVLRLQSGQFYTIDGVPIKIGIKGLPDLLFIGDNGFVAWIEMKRPGGHRRPDQIKFINLMKSMGQTAGFCESVEDALKLINVGLT